MTSPPDTSGSQVSLSPGAFLSAFPGHWVQYFDDTPARDPRKALATPRFDPRQAREKQRAGCGVFFSPNGFDGMRRTGNLSRVQAAYIDLDLAREGDGTPQQELVGRLDRALAALRSCPLPPHAVTRTKNGLQAVWRVEPVSGPQALSLFRETEDLLVGLFHGDPAARDVTRVLRLPGFLHLKDPTRPFLCHLLVQQMTRAAYRLEDLRDGLRALDAGNRRAADAPGRPGKGGGGAWVSALAGVAAGGRNAAAASIAGKLLASLAPELWETGGWGGLQQWNAGNRPPLGERELRGVFESIARRERRSREARGREEDAGPGCCQADRLVGLALQQNLFLFRDQFGQAQASVPIGGHAETWRVRGRQLRVWLSSLLWEREGRAPGTTALASALTVLEGRAFFRGPRIPLSNRVAWHDGALWYDLANDGWEAVRITEAGWQVISRPPVLFQRHAHQAAQVTPRPGGDVRALLPFLNLAEPGQGVLLLVFLACCFLPGIPHPVALLHGPQGAAKTTLARMLRRLVDPSVVELLALPASAHALVQQLSHHWFAFFDNVTDLPEWASDTLCRAVTGAGFTKRELYSDDDDVIYGFRRCVGLNGISPAARKADLLDRAVLFRLERIAPEGRKTERALWAAFEEARPAILGGVFDALSRSLHRRGEADLPVLPRMADFAERGCAVAEALGFDRREFLDAYQENIGEQHAEAIQASPVATVLAAFMQDRAAWQGSASDLLGALTDTAERENIRTKTGTWPVLPNVLMRRLNEARANLAETGIRLASRKAGGGRRVILLERTGGTAAGGGGPGGERGDAGRAGPSPPTGLPGPASGDVAVGPACLSRPN